MPYNDNFSPDAARHNHIDQRLGGILDFDNRNAWDEGPGHLDWGSGDAIELELSGANFQMGGKVGVPSGSVTLSDGEGGGLWRLDHIYASEDRTWNVLEGEPMSNEYVVSEVADEALVSEDPDTIIEDDYSAGDVVHHRLENEQAGGPAPKGQDFAQRAGELMFSVLVPPGADDASDLSQQHVLDRRREAIDLLNTDRPRQSNVTVPEFTLNSKESKIVPMNIWPGTTFRLWDYSIFQAQYGVFSSDNFELYVVDINDVDPDELESEQRELEVSEHIDDGDSIHNLTRRYMDWNWSEHALWETTELFHTPIDGGEWKEPILDIDHPSGTGTDALYFIIKNVSDNVVYRERGSLSAQLTTSVERTEDV